MGCELILYYGVGLILKVVKTKKRIYHASMMYPLVLLDTLMCRLSRLIQPR